MSLIKKKKNCHYQVKMNSNNLTFIEYQFKLIVNETMSHHFFFLAQSDKKENHIKVIGAC